MAILARRLSDVSGKQNSEEEVSSAGEKPSPVRKVICSLSSKKTTRQPPKITVHDRKWTDGSVPLDVLPNELAKLGKVVFVKSDHSLFSIFFYLTLFSLCSMAIQEALLRKNIAATAAVEALEEACSTESLLRNLRLLTCILFVFSLIIHLNFYKFLCFQPFLRSIFFSKNIEPIAHN